MVRGLRVPARWRSARWRHAGALCCLLAVLLTVAASGETPAPRPAMVASTTAIDRVEAPRAAAFVPPDPDHPGALAHQQGFRYTGRAAAEIMPPPALPAPDWVPTPTGPECRRPAPGSLLQVCARLTPWTPTRRIVVVGDSHTQQYAGALEASAERRHWQIVTMLRGACPFSTASETLPGSRECVDWNAAARAEIRALRPDLVVTTATRNVRVGLTETTPPGFVEAWQELAQAGVPILAVRDSPRYGHSPADCVRTFGAGSPACATPRSTLLAPVPPYRRLAGVPPTVTFFDPGDHLCTATACSPTVGNVLVYFDDNHLTATFTRTLGPILTEQVEPLLTPPGT